MKKRILLFVGAAGLFVVGMMLGRGGVFFSEAAAEPFDDAAKTIYENGNAAARTSSSAQTEHAQLSTADHIKEIYRRFGGAGCDGEVSNGLVERVEHYINHNATSPRRRRWLDSTLTRGAPYFPMIHRVLAERNLPADLVYLALQESAFKAEAVSHANAAGLWQFITRTGRAYGLRITDRVDDRLDPVKSTYAAAQYLLDLIAVFGPGRSATLAMAGYNAGEVRISRALAEIENPIRDRDFWTLYELGMLANETNEYVPQIIALIIMGENWEAHGFKLDIPQDSAETVARLISSDTPLSASKAAAVASAAIRPPPASVIPVPAPVRTRVQMEQLRRHQ